MGWLGGAVRWLMVVCLLCAGVVFLAGLAAAVARDESLLRHSVVLPATIEASAPYGDDRQYRLSFALDGWPEQAWSHEVGSHTSNDTVLVVLDRRNMHVESTHRLDTRWWRYAVAAVYGVGCLALSVWFLRMDRHEFRDLSRSASGPPPG